MKKWYLLTIQVLIFSVSASASTQDYYTLMKENIALMKRATTLDDYQAVANTFQRYSFARPEAWQSYYYCSYCYVQMSYLAEEKSERDRLVEEANKYIYVSDSLSPENSEIYVLRGFTLQAYMDIDRLVRGMKYNNECISMFKKAEKLNPANPRSYLWHAIQLLNTPSFMGGGIEKALPYMKTALIYFKEFVPENEISPDWGHNYAMKKFEEITRQ